MRILALGALLGTALLMVGELLPAPGVPAPAPTLVAHRRPDVPVATLTEVVRSYCVVCHNDQLLTGNLSLQAFDVEQAAQNAPTAERMIRKLRAGMMPPPGAPR